MTPEQETEEKEPWQQEEIENPKTPTGNPNTSDSASIKDNMRDLGISKPRKIPNYQKSSRQLNDTQNIHASSDPSLLLQSSADTDVDKAEKASANIDEEVRSIIDHVKDVSIVQEEDNSVGVSGIIQSRSSASTFQNQTSSPHSPKLDLKKETEALACNSTRRSEELSRTPPQKAKTQVKPTGPTSPSTRATNLNPGIHRRSLPPEPEPDIRFNFHLFLEQLRHRTADPVARYLRSFLVEFGKKQWTVQEQVRIISDFLNFISGKMAQCEIWRDSTEAEFDNAGEGMEKLVMNRLYTQTFSPELPPPMPSSSDASGRRRSPKHVLPGRKGQHQEDVERDTVLCEKMQIFSWVEEQHLDIKPVSAEGKRFLSLAQDELLKINNYRAPRDKVICILNACKVIFGLLRSSNNTDTSADSFMPLLIYIVLRARPQHLVSNLQYIFRFRNQEKLGGEAGYYLSSLMGAVHFVENLDKTALTVSDKEFERRVEASVAAIAERQPDITSPKDDAPNGLLEPKYTVGKSTSRPPLQTDVGDSNGPVQGILKNIQRPLTNLGRIFSDERSELEPSSSSILGDPNSSSTDTILQQDLTQTQNRPENGNRHVSGGLLPDVDVDNIVETLSSMFPSLDRDVISDIVIAKQARVGASVDACLAMTSQG